MNAGSDEDIDSVVSGPSVDTGSDDGDDIIPNPRFLLAVPPGTGFCIQKPNKTPIYHGPRFMADVSFPQTPR